MVDCFAKQSCNMNIRAIVKIAQHKHQGFITVGARNRGSYIKTGKRLNGPDHRFAEQFAARLRSEKLIDGTYISFILLAASVAACLLISYAAMMSPFKSKGKKIFVSLLMIAWAWLLAVLIAIFL